MGPGSVSGGAVTPRSQAGAAPGKNESRLEEALHGHDVVIHLAALVPVPRP